MNRIRVTILILCLLSLLMGGCANVRPWEHGTLASYGMNRDRAPLNTAIAEHVYLSREASTGGAGVGGAGCGCN